MSPQSSAMCHKSISNSFRIVSYRIVSYRIVSYRIVSHCIASYRIVWHRIASYRFISHHMHLIASYRIISHCITSFRIVLYHIVSIGIQIISLVWKGSRHQVGLQFLQKSYFRICGLSGHRSQTTKGMFKLTCHIWILTCEFYNEEKYARMRSLQFLVRLVFSALQSGFADP